MFFFNAGPAISVIRKTAIDLNNESFSKAVNRALNETILLARTTGRKSVKDIYNIPQKNLSGINVEKARGKLLTAKLYASATPIPMDAFSPIFIKAGRSITVTKKGVQKIRGTRNRKAEGGVTIEVFKGKRENIPYAFMIAGAKPRVFARGEYKRGMQYGFVRRNKRVNNDGNDIPIKPLLSVTVHAAVINKVALKRVENQVITQFPIVLARNVGFLLRGSGT